MQGLRNYGFSFIVKYANFSVLVMVIVMDA